MRRLPQQGQYFSISDVDDDDSPVFNDVASILGDNAYGSFTLTSGTWTYTLDQSTVQNLDAGDIVNDTITYTATDGSSQQITVTITGSDDTSVITGYSNWRSNGRKHRRCTGYRNRQHFDLRYRRRRFPGIQRRRFDVRRQRLRFVHAHIWDLDVHAGSDRAVQNLDAE